MFALEITFQDGVSPPEILLVRRSQALIGTSEFAHVVIDGAPAIPYELRVTRGLGREFHCHAVKRPGNHSGPPPFPEGLYTGEASITLGDVSTYITALDADLHILPNESPDRAGVRVLRGALTGRSSMFPAVAVLGASPVFVSFPEGQAIVVGRSRKCGLRLDSSGISGEHARIGFENGAFWVEDLGSTNGTFVSGERVSGRRNLAPDETVLLGSEFSIAGVRNLDDVASLGKRSSSAVVETQEELTYPALLCKSELVRPSRLVLKQNKRFNIGRDPASDVWVGAPHISRSHLSISVDGTGKITVLDMSSNGTYLNDERLTREQEVVLPDGFCVIDLKEGIRFHLCCNQHDEDEFNGLPTQRPSPFSQQFAGDASDAPLEETLQATPAVSRGGESVRSLGVFQRMAQREGNRASENPNDGYERPSVLETAHLDRGDFSDADQDAIDFIPRQESSRLAIVVSVFGIVGLIGLLSAIYLLR